MAIKKPEKRINYFDDSMEIESDMEIDTESESEDDDLVNHTFTNHKDDDGLFVKIVINIDTKNEENIDEIMNYLDNLEDGYEYSSVKENDINEYNWTIKTFIILSLLNPTEYYEIQENIEEFISEGLDERIFNVRMTVLSEEEFNNLIDLDEMD